MDGRAWWAVVHGVVKSRTWLKDFTFTFHLHVLEKEMAIHSSVLAWRIPGTGEPGGLPSMGSHRVRHDWSDLAAAAADVLRTVHRNWLTSTGAEKHDNFVTCNWKLWKHLILWFCTRYDIKVIFFAVCVCIFLFIFDCICSWKCLFIVRQTSGWLLNEVVILRLINLDSSWKFINS